MKSQHGAYLRQLDTKNLDPVKSMAWVNGCFLDPHTESYLFAAQELALFTRYHECHILKLRDDDLCRICRKETSQFTISWQDVIAWLGANILHGITAFASMYIL